MSSQSTPAAEPARLPYIHVEFAAAESTRYSMGTYEVTPEQLLIIGETLCLRAKTYIAAGLEAQRQRAEGAALVAVAGVPNGGTPRVLPKGLHRG